MPVLGPSYITLSAYALAMRLLYWRRSYATSLRACHAMSGTDLAYAATSGDTRRATTALAGYRFPALRNQIQKPAELVQIGVETWFVGVDFGVCSQCALCCVVFLLPGPKLRGFMLMLVSWGASEREESKAWMGYTKASRSLKKS
eukprot:3048836-Rhodomonas_salina.1